MEYSLRERIREREKENAGEEEIQQPMSLRQRQRMKNAGSAAQDITQRVNQWLKDSEKYIDSYNDRFADRDNSVYVSDAEIWLSDARFRKAALDTERQKILESVEKYRDYVSQDWVDSVNNALDTYGKIHDKVILKAAEDRNFWNQFTPTQEQAEAGYTAQMLYDDARRYADPVLAKEEISSAEAEWKARQQDAIDAEKAYAAYANWAFQPGIPGDGEDPDKVSEQVNELQQAWVAAKAEAEKAKAKYDELNNKFAGYINYYDKYLPYTKAEDFDQYSSAGSELSYTDFGSEEQRVTKGSRVNIRYTTIDNYRAAAIALYEHNGGKADPNDTKRYSREIDIYRTMKDEEFQLLAYFIAKDKAEGTNLAEQYVDDMEDTLKSRRGYEIANDLDNINIPVIEDIAKLAAGFESGSINAITGFNQFFASERLPTDVSQYANAYISESLDGIGYYAHQAATTIGNMMPSVLVSAIFGPAAGAATMGVSVAGNAYAQALDCGYDKTQARVYGTIVGALEGGLQYAIGGISKLSGVQGGKILSKIAAIDNAALRISAKLSWETLKEIGEEELQNYLEPLVRNIVFGEEYDAPTIEELLDTAITTVMSTFALEGPETIINDVHETARINKKMKPYGSVQNELVGEALEINPENAYAQKMQGRLDKGKQLSGRQLYKLVQQNEAALTAQDMSSIRSAAAQRLTELGETGYVGSIAAAIAKQAKYQIDYNDAVRQFIAEGETEAAAKEKAGKEVPNPLSDSEKEAIANSKFGQKVADEMNPDNFKSGDYSSAWAEKLDTQRINVQEYSRLVESDQLDSTPTENTGVTDTTNGMVNGNLTAEEKNAADSSYDVSAEGKTIRKDTGDVVSISRISDIRDGKVILLLEDGSTVDAENVSFSSRDEALIYETVANMKTDAEGANTLVQGYAKSGLSADMYANAIEEAYNYGNLGVDYADMVSNGVFSTELDNAVRKYAYNLGRMALASDKSSGYNKTTNMEGDNHGTGEELHLRGGVQRTDSEGSGRPIPGVGEGTGAVQNGQKETAGRSGDGGKDHGKAQGKVSTKELGVTSGTEVRNLSYADDTTAQMKEAKALAKQHGLELVAFTGGNLTINSEDGVFEARAYICGNKVCVRADHPNFSLMQLLKHEIGHHKIRKGNVDMKKVYNAIADFASEEYVQHIIASYVAAYSSLKGYDADYILEEILCDYEAGMNIFSKETVPDSFWEMSQEILKSDAVKQDTVRGPPNADGKASVDNKQEVNTNERREETRENFFRRANEALCEVGQRGALAWGYRPNISGQTSENARTAGEELSKLGVPFIIHTLLETNRDGITRIETGDACTIPGIPVFISNNIVTDPVETAGHEAFHYWGRSNEKTNYIDVVVFNINFASAEFIAYQNDRIRNQYFSEDVEVGSKDWETLMEEVIAYISGDIHSGDPRGEVHAFLRDYDAVKAAWDTLVESKAPTQKQNGKFSREVSDKEDGQKNTANDGGVQHQARSSGYDYSKSFEQQVDDYKNGVIPKGDTLIVGATPDVYQSIGFNALPMTINTTHVDYALNGTKDADHYLGESVLKQLPESIKKPVAVFTSNTKVTSSVVAVLNFTVNGKQTVLPIVIDGFGVNNKVVFDSNSVTSVYGKTTAIKQLDQAIQNEANGQFALLYINKKEATTLLHRAGHQLTGSLIPRDGFIHSIREKDSPVKPKFKNVTESQQFKRWFGDWQKHPQNASKVVNADGTPKVVYHQTAKEFTVFDNSSPVAGKNDSETPNGFFFKDNDHDIGIGGSKQMAVYLDMKKPLHFANREAANNWYCKNINGYSSLQKEMTEALSPISAEMDTIENQMFSDEVTDEQYNVLDQKWNALLEQMKSVEGEFRSRLRKLLDDYFLYGESGYDGIILDYDGHRYVNGKRENVNTYIVFNRTQIKSATDNIGTFDGSNPDIRFSREFVQEQKRLQDEVTSVLEKENAKLKEDVSSLKEMLKLQRTVTGGTKFTKTSVEAAARMLKKKANVKNNADTKALMSLLNDFYGYIAKGEELTWENVMAAAQPAVDWLKANERKAFERDEYAQYVLDTVRGRSFYMDEEQKGEAAHRYGSYQAFLQKLMGTFTISDNANMSLDAFWKELSAEHPYYFPADVNSGDQVEAILDAVKTIRNAPKQEGSDFGYSEKMANQNLLYEVYDSYWSVSTLYTQADINQRKINRLKMEHSNKLAEIKAENRRKTQELEVYYRDRVEQIRKAYNERLNKKQKDFAEKYREQRRDAIARRNEAESVRKYRSVVEKAAKSLMKVLAHPTKDVHVPAELQEPLREFLDTIDFSSKQLSGNGTATIRDIAYTRALDDVRLAVAAQRTALDGVEGGVFALDVPKEFVETIERHKKNIQDATKGMDLTTNRVYEMSGAELADLAFVLNTINKAIRDIDKLHMEGAKARVSDLAQSTQAEMKRRKAVNGETGNSFMWANYTPYHAFRRMGKAAQQVFKGLTKGQAKLARTIYSAIQFTKQTYSAKEVQSWEDAKNAKTIELDSGETIRLTPAQIMSFWCLSKREHAMGHMNGGGIGIETIGNGTSKIVQKGKFTLTIADINRINSLLTDRQMAVAADLQKYMQNVGSRLINEISMARWDYMAATEENYFPIKTDDATRDAKAPGQETANLWALLNKSFTKSPQPNAKNALMIGSIFDVFADHMSETAEYNAFALPLVDAMRWFNYRERVQAGDTEGTQIQDIGVHEALRDTLGTAATKYFIDLMTDINSSQKAGRHEDMLGKMLSRSKVASVGWNLRVAIQQGSAILRATLILDMPSLLKGTLRIGTKELVEEMQKYSGIALWKSLGYYDLNVSRSVREQIKGDNSALDKFNEAGMWLPGKMDEITWARIWAATKEKVAKERKLTGEALLTATAELFEDIVYQTQVADSVLTRSSLMRSKSQLMKEATAFMSEPTISLNILMSAFQDYEDGHTKWDKTKRALMIGFNGYVLSSIANALLASLMDAWRDDDEYEDFLHKYRQALLGENSFFDGNLFDELNPIGKIVFVRDAMSIIQGYDVSPSYARLVSYGSKFVSSAQKYMEGKGSKELYGVIYEGLQLLSTGTGVAVTGLTREAVSIWNNTFAKLWPELKVNRYKRDVDKEIEDAFATGALTEEEARELYISDGGYTQKEAAAKARALSLEKQYPEVWEFYNDTSSDYDDDGKTVKSKKEKVVEYINGLNISQKEKDDLFLCFYKESGLSDTPWH